LSKYTRAAADTPCAPAPKYTLFKYRVSISSLLN
jgi:hypothetical protein